MELWWLCVWLCVVVMLGQSDPASLDLVMHQDEDAENDRWLADEVFYDPIDFHDQPQGDQAFPQLTELCPPVSAKLPQGSCHAQTCTSDRECESEEGGQKCCYNGCIYTCLPQLSSPAYLDWIREPRRRLSSGLSWLVNGPDRINEEETCSTTPVEKDADPLICPRGYTCSIFDEGEPEKGVPNQGTCVKLADGEEEKTNDEDEDYDSSEEIVDDRENDDNGDDEEDNDNGDDYDDLFPTGWNFEHPIAEPGDGFSHHAVIHAHACDLDGRMLLEGHEIYLDGKQCICKDKRLFCSGDDQVV